MIVNELITLLRYFLEIMGENVPENVKTSLSLLNEYNNKWTHHGLKKTLKSLKKTLRELIERERGNKDYFKSSKLDFLLNNLSNNQLSV